MRLGDQAISVVRAPLAENDYGNQERDWSRSTTTVVEHCSIQPMTGEEITVGRETVVSRWYVYAPADTDLVATDRVAFDGATYEVDGEVQRWDFPPLSHVQAMLRKGDA